MILPWLRRLLGPEKPKEPEPPSLRRRVADLESDQDYLNGEIEKLRGRMTGFLRKKREETPPDEPDEVEPTRPELPTANGGGTTAHLSKRFRRW